MVFLRLNPQFFIYLCVESELSSTELTRQVSFYNPTKSIAYLFFIYVHSNEHNQDRSYYDVARFNPGFKNIYTITFNDIIISIIVSDDIIIFNISHNRRKIDEKLWGKVHAELS